MLERREEQFLLQVPKLSYLIHLVRFGAKCHPKPPNSVKIVDFLGF